MKERVTEVVSGIGRKVQGLRKAKSYSLQALADRSDVSAAAIHKIEANNMVPTISTLMKIAAALEKPVSYFVDEDDEQASAVKIEPDTRPDIYTSHTGIDLAGISGPYGEFLVAGAVATVVPGATSGKKPMYHDGEELLFVLSGSFQFEVSGTIYDLEPGDSLHFQTQQPHTWRNLGKEDATLVWLILRPQQMDRGY